MSLVISSIVHIQDAFLTESQSSNALIMQYVSWQYTNVYYSYFPVG